MPDKISMYIVIAYARFYFHHLRLAFFIYEDHGLVLFFCWLLVVAGLICIRFRRTIIIVVILFLDFAFIFGLRVVTDASGTDSAFFWSLLECQR
jgi:hypothetical protein